jgi:pyruvate formate lyase activating enzyme
VAFTYNDPVIFLEYAIDTAQACRETGIRTVAVSNGYICPAPRAEFFASMDAANIDLKAFSERFYWKICGGHLQPVLETLEYVASETDTWLELTTLLIPGENDSAAEIEAMSRWIFEHLGPDVPLHFSAFHPAWKMQDTPPTPTATLRRARSLALDQGLHYVYTGNVHDFDGSSTYCPGCGEILIGRDWYELSNWNLSLGRCGNCSAPIAGVFEATPGHWGSRRQQIDVRH